MQRVRTVLAAATGCVKTTLPVLAERRHVLDEKMAEGWVRVGEQDVESDFAVTRLLEHGKEPARANDAEGEASAIRCDVVDQPRYDLGARRCIGGRPQC